MSPIAAAVTSRRSRAFATWAGGLLVLWCLALFASPALLAALGLPLNAHAQLHLYPHGHPFVDARPLAGLPNAMDVLSNLPLVLAGLFGLWRLRGQALPEVTRAAPWVFLAGLVLTGLGSAWYHWAPDAGRLVWDRLGMAVCFAGALALATAERVGLAPVRAMLGASLLLAAVSALLPFTHDRLLPWVVVQFGGMAFLVWATGQSPVAGGLGVRIGALVAGYALAKLLELGDGAVFHALGGAVSGHSLKHVAAALAAWPVIAALGARRQALRQNAPALASARA